MAEQTITIEVTKSQYEHYQSVMTMDKPSRTRLTRDEKSMIHLICTKFLNDYDNGTEYDKLIQSIINKMK
jgi:hypothetical protein